MEEQITLIQMLEPFQQITFGPYDFAHDLIKSYTGFPDYIITVMIGLGVMWFFWKFLMRFDTNWISDSISYIRSKRSNSKSSKDHIKNKITLTQKILSSIGLVKIKRI